MNYYYLIAGLPDISPEDKSIALSPTEIKEELLSAVSQNDRLLLEYYLLKHDNTNLITLLKGEEETRWEDGGIYTIEQLREAIDSIKLNGESTDVSIPTYMIRFISMHFNAADEEAKGSLFPESRLSDLYYKQLFRDCKHPTIRSWFEFCLNLGNLLTAANCRRLNFNAEPYIIGEGQIADALRISQEKDWGIGSDIDYVKDVLEIVAETDVLTKERKLDELKWKHLEGMFQDNYFGIEHIFAFIVCLDIIARWVNLDSEKGEQKLRTMIGNLKNYAISNQTI